MSRHTLFSSATLALLLSVSFLSEVDASGPPPPPPPGGAPMPRMNATPPLPVVDDSRGGLLDAIRNKKKSSLKPTVTVDKSGVPGAVPQPGDQSSVPPSRTTPGGSAPHGRSTKQQIPVGGGDVQAELARRLAARGGSSTHPSTPAPSTSPKPKIVAGATCPPGRVLTEKVTVSGKTFTRPSASNPIIKPIVLPSTPEEQLSATDVQRELETWRDTHTASQSHLFNEFLGHFRHPETAGRDGQEEMNYLRDRLTGAEMTAIGRLATVLNDGYKDKNENVRALSRFFGNLLNEVTATESKRKKIRNLLEILQQDLDHPHVALPPVSSSAPVSPRVDGGHELPVVVGKQKATSAPEEIAQPRRVVRRKDPTQQVSSIPSLSAPSALATTPGETSAPPRRVVRRKDPTQQVSSTPSLSAPSALATTPGAGETSAPARRVVRRKDPTQQVSSTPSLSAPSVLATTPGETSAPARRVVRRKDPTQQVSSIPSLSAPSVPPTLGETSAPARRVVRKSTPPTKNTGAPTPPAMPRAKAPPPPPTNGAPRPMTGQAAPAFLGQIGTKPQLKKVDPSQIKDRSSVQGAKKQSSEPPKMGGMFGALAQVLANRRNDIGESKQQDDESSSFSD